MIKMAFLIWTVLPQFNGAERIYNQYIKVYLDKNEKAISSVVQSISEKASSLVDATPRNANTSMDISNIPVETSITAEAISFVKSIVEQPIKDN